MSIWRPLEDRFWEKVNKNGPIPSLRPDLGPCWVWIASTRNGYGRVRGEDGRNLTAHCWAYIQKFGAIPEELELDHLCRNRSCVNPDHLEPVTAKINTQRGTGPGALNATKTRCKNGHLFDEENTYVRTDRTGNRECRTCTNKRGKRYKRKQRAARAIKQIGSAGSVYADESY